MECDLFGPFEEVNLDCLYLREHTHKTPTAMKTSYHLAIGALALAMALQDQVFCFIGRFCV